MLFRHKLKPKKSNHTLVFIWFFFTSLLPEEGPIIIEIAPSDPKAPKTVESQAEEEVEKSSEGTGSTQSPFPADSADKDANRKGKHQEDLTS
jgi:hypothetical protein